MDIVPEGYKIIISADYTIFKNKKDLMRGTKLTGKL